MTQPPTRRRHAPQRDPSGAHFDLIDARCYDVVARVVRLLEDTGRAYVLVGGWAVHAYGSTVPSVDTDVFLDKDTAPAIMADVRSIGVTVGPNQQFEPLDIDAPALILGTDAELGEPERGYLPRQVLEGRVVRRELDLPSGRFRVPVPEPGVLAFMKLKAYHDRSMAWNALRDPAMMAHIPPPDRATVRAKDVTYYLRKAGKDLYDFGYLAAHPGSADAALGLARETGLHNDLAPLVQTPPPGPLRTFAVAMSRRGGDDATQAWLDALGT